MSELDKELQFVLNCLRGGQVEPLLDLVEHPQAECVEVALDALTNENGSLAAAIAAVIEYAR